MARISGVDLPSNKRVEIALTYVYGIGRSRAKKIVTENKIDINRRLKDLTEGELIQLRDYIGKHFKVEGELRTEVSMNIKRLMDTGCYRGLRHRRSLPVNGQRTKTNAKTVRRKGGGTTRPGGKKR